MAEAAPGEVQAAGAVLWRARAGGTEVALVHRPRYDDWSFPKGKSLPGEHVLLTAVREVEEETGVRVALGRRLGSQSYLADGQPKRVEYWAARPVSPERFAPNDEVDALAWLPLAEAREQLSYPRDHAVLDTFTAGPLDTAPVILLRHASAVAKKEWRQAGHASDLSRPLSGRGRAQAAALAGLLGSFAPAQVISSAAERCLATVAPYADRAGVPVLAEPAFTVDGTASGHGGDDWVETPAARWRVTAAVAAPVPDGPALPHGAFWVLQVGGRRLASAEQHGAEAEPRGGSRGVAPP